MGNRKPNVFIGSARESMHYVNAIHEQCKHFAEITPWYAGVFGENEYTMESLEKQLDRNDFAVFVFSPDDVTESRGQKMLKTRDNTLFELGLFWGRLRRGRVFFVVPDRVQSPTEEEPVEYVLPSDLDGLTTLEYEIRPNDSNYSAAVSRAANKINETIQNKGPFEDPNILLGETNDELMKSYAILSFYLQFTKALLGDHDNKYEHLYDAFRSSFVPPNDYQVVGAGVWKVIGSEGLKQIAGNEGRNKFYPFHINDDRDEGNKILVVDCYLNSEEQVTLIEDVSMVKIYLICYPIGKELVVTIHVRGRHYLAEHDLNQLFVINHELLSSINYLFGGIQNE